jgi:VanZ family protein
MPIAVVYWVPALLYMAGIFIVSSIPDLGPLPGGVSDKSGHTLAYAGLGALLLFALARGRPERVTLGRAAIAVALASAYGVTDEWHQSFVPGRSAEVADVLADVLGAALGVALAAALATLWTTKRRGARK